MSLLPLALLRCLALGAAIALGAPVHAALAPDQLAEVGVRPPPGARLPLNVRLADLDGRPVTLGEAIGARPAVVVFADYDCPQLCSPILALARDALAKSGRRPGVDYRMVVIGFNPRATAADGKRMVGGQIGFDSPVGRATAALTASPRAAERLMSAVGYHAEYDAAAARYAHPAVLLVVAADGRLSRVLSGLSISGDDVRRALVEAGRGGFGEIVDQVRLLCYGLAASVGVYDRPVRLLLAGAGAVTMLALAGGVVALARTARRRA